ncbi:MAG: hypothetical protein HYT77_08345 [Deltaproteobacteria bacterium]|nr:hypothetical protein [Deltaproteobacteria bacterium]
MKSPLSQPLPAEGKESTNTGLLKLELIASGINLGEGLPSPLTNPFGLIHLILPEGVSVSVQQASDKQQTPFTLLHHGKRFFLNFSGKETPVQWVPPLKCYHKKTRSGILISDILTVHSGLIAVHPKGPCRFGLSGLACRYCGSSRELSNHPPFSKQDLIEAIQTVLKETSCDVVHLSSGHVETEDGGIVWLTPWVTEIRKHIDILISLDLAPPKSNSWIDQSYAMGVDAVYYDLGDFAPHQVTGNKKSEEDKKRYLETIEYAARIFPKGAVLSHLVIGLEPMGDTQKGIDLLVERGVVPLLVYFPPSPHSPLSERWKMKPEEVTPLYTHLFERLVQVKNTPHWVHQQDVLLTPLEGRFFSEKSAGFHLALKKFYETGFGRKVRRSMIGIRRRLRVKHHPAGYR